MIGELDPKNTGEQQIEMGAAEGPGQTEEPGFEVVIDPEFEALGLDVQANYTAAVDCIQEGRDQHQAKNN